MTKSNSLENDPPTDADPISNLPSQRKLRDQLEQMRAAKALTENPLVKAILEITGEDSADLETELARAEELGAAHEKSLSDVVTFNRLFTARGWIVYDHLDLKLVKAANEIALEGDLDAAEAAIADHYDETTIRYKLNLLKYVKAFSPKLPLARKALDDYAAGRYYASVLVVLTLVDGLVQEAHEKRRGFFAEGTDLTAWDSIAAHSQGLMELARYFAKTRVNTTTDPMTMPYRHGIMHGVDLGYDNKLVAAKVWALLFTVRDWAVRTQNGELRAPPEKPEPTIEESLEGWQAVQQDKAAIEAWQPRQLAFGVDLPVTGAPELYQAGTPEHVLVELLNAWQSQNYGFMRDCMCVGIRKMDQKELFYRLRNWYAGRPLQSFELRRFEREASGAVDIVTALWFAGDDGAQEETITFRLVCETSAGRPSLEGAADAHWGLLWWRELRRSDSLYLRMN